MKRYLFPPWRSGMTRIEVVVLVIVIFMMMALLFPFIQHLLNGNSGHPQGVRCINNMKNLGLAMSQFSVAQGEYPPAQRTNKEGEIQFGWRIALLPNLEQQQMYKEITNNLPWDSEHNRQFEDKKCPLSLPVRGFLI